MIVFSNAAPEDLHQIRMLLIENQLPDEDVHLHIQNFIVARSDDYIVGTIGMESYGEECLLRSMAVSTKLQKQNIGRELYSRLLSSARQKNIRRIHLLTTTAYEYFLKLGFEMADRNLAPHSIKNTLQFSSLCPSSADYMVKVL